MTRPKVSEDKRQRTAHACDSCKRRKQKCNGDRPCNACTKRQASCHYSPSKPPRGVCIVQKPPQTLQRAHIFKTVDMSKYATVVSKRSVLDLPTRSLSVASRVCSPSHRRMSTTFRSENKPQRLSYSSGPETTEEPANNGRPRSTPVAVESRLLQGTTGKLYFIGESSSLALLQTVRNIVESTMGPCLFTTDIMRTRLFEISLPIHSAFPAPSALPHRKEAYELAEIYFLHTHGVIEVLDPSGFWQALDACYLELLAVHPSDLCIVHLVLAIGSLMRQPFARTHHGLKHRHCSDTNDEKAAKLFQVASFMLDELFEPGQPDTWVVKAHVLCTIYHLILSRRNAAEEYHGRAVRLAIALGLQKSWDILPAAEKREVVLNRRIWSSLFVLDRFIASSLGRPLAIHDHDHPISSRKLQHRSGPQRKLNHGKTGGVIEASCRLGKILNDISHGRHVSRDPWSQGFEACDQTTEADLEIPQIQQTDDPTQVVALLHWRLTDDHATILQSREFFLALVVETLQQDQNMAKKDAQTRPIRGALTPCVRAAARSILLARNALSAGALPVRNPFITYYIFSATLIILCSDLAGLQTPGAGGNFASQGLRLLHHWARVDSQAGRFLFVLSSLEAAVETYRRRRIGTKDTTRASSTCASSTSEMKPTGSATEDQGLDISRLTSFSPSSDTCNLDQVDDRSAEVMILPCQDSSISSLRDEQSLAMRGNKPILAPFTSRISPSLVRGADAIDVSTTAATGNIAEMSQEDIWGMGNESFLYGLQLPREPFSDVFDPALWDALPALGGNELL